VAFGAGFGREVQSGGDHDPPACCSGAAGWTGAWATGAGAASGNAGCTGAGAFQDCDAIHDWGSGCGAAAGDSAVHADVRTGATWLTGAS